MAHRVVYSTLRVPSLAKAQGQYLLEGKDVKYAVALLPLLFLLVFGAENQRVVRFLSHFSTRRFLCQSPGATIGFVIGKHVSLMACFSIIFGQLVSKCLVVDQERQSALQTWLVPLLVSSALERLRASAFWGVASGAACTGIDWNWQLYPQDTGFEEFGDILIYADNVNVHEACVCFI